MMDSVIPNLDSAYLRILYWFFSFPSKVTSLSDLAKAVHLSKTTSTAVVKRLKKEGFLEVESIGRVWRIKSNPNHPYNLSNKVAYNLQNVLESDINEEAFKKVPQGRCLILFGSYRKGDDVESSDVDVAMEVLGGVELKVMELGKIPCLGFRRDVQVNLHIFSRAKVNPNLFANIANGIVLSGFLEVRP